MTFQVTFCLLFLQKFSSAAFKFCSLTADFQLSRHVEAMSSCFFFLMLCLEVDVSHFNGK